MVKDKWNMPSCFVTVENNHPVFASFSSFHFCFLPLFRLYFSSFLLIILLPIFLLLFLIVKTKSYQRNIFWFFLRDLFITRCYSQRIFAHRQIFVSIYVNSSICFVSASVCVCLCRRIFALVKKLIFPRRFQFLRFSLLLSRFQVIIFFFFWKSLKVSGRATWTLSLLDEYSVFMSIFDSFSNASYFAIYAPPHRDSLNFLTQVSARQISITSSPPPDTCLVYAFINW